MRICFALANQHLKDTAQVKIMDVFFKMASKEHQVSYIPEMNIFKTIDYLWEHKPDIIHPNGYKMSLFMWVANWFCGATFIVTLSETIEVVDNWFLKRLIIFALKKARVIFVTSEYIQRQLERYGVKSEVMRVYV